MKNKVLKISVILVMILTMTMTNFIFVGSSLISYAVDDITTNHKNVEFKAYTKEGEKDFLYLQVNVKKEGYLNGSLTLEESNFQLKEIVSQSDYVNKLENNTIYLNQMNAGTVEEIKVKMEPRKEENFSIGLLNMTSKITIAGIYRDSTERDIAIKATREIQVPLEENNTNDSVNNEIQVITNQIIKIEQQEKRVLQLRLKMGLKENNYPIQEIKAKIAVPTIEGKQVQVEKVEYLNNMTAIDYQYDGTQIELTLKNEVNQEGKVMWKAQGEEDVIITCLYDADVKLENSNISSYQKVKLYNNKEIETQNDVIIGVEELDSTVEISSKNKEETIYKGKLNAGIGRQYESTTELKVNLAKAVNSMEVVENNDPVVTFEKTKINKQQFTEILGENGILTLYDQAGDLLETIHSTTPVDQEENFIISYEGKNVTAISLQTTKPEKEGILEICHTKTIHAGTAIANELKTNLTMKEKTIETILKLEEATTKAKLEINKETLSTIIGNNVEIKAILVSNEEQYDLYKNPQLTIELPEEVQNIQINSIDMLYDNELKIKNYSVEGRNIKIDMEGEQTQYKDAIEGATVVINTTINVNRKAPTAEKEIKMAYQNQEMGSVTKPIKIVAPTDITTVYNLPELGVETIGQEEATQVLLPRNTEEKQTQAQIEIINNQEEDIENVKILGVFPTNHSNNNLGIEITKGITLSEGVNADVYYTENEKATDEIQKTENGWSKTIVNTNKVSKYLILLENVPTGNSIQATYEYKLPSNLDYNQNATTSYLVKYTNSNTKVENEITSTTIEIQTGVGPQIETELIATVGGKEITNPIKTGEVVHYRTKITNTGTEEATNVILNGKVPEGTTLVVPEENYEYTGASYYQEKDDKTYEATIQSIKPKEVIYHDYEVRVNTNTPEGTNIKNQIEIQYGDVTKRTEENTNTIARGDLRVTVKRVTDRKVELSTSGVVRYFAIIENISTEKQENVKIETNLTENVKVERLSLTEGMEEADQGKENQLEYSNEIAIGAIEPGEAKIVRYNVSIHKVQGVKNEINFSVIGKKGNETYQSNQWIDKVKDIEVGISMTTNTESQYLQAGDVIEYNIAVENKTNFNTNEIVVKDAIPTKLTINRVLQDGKDIEKGKGNNLSLPIAVGGNQTSNIKIEAVVDYSQVRDEAEVITNVAHVELYGETIATTAEINHIIKANTNKDEIPGGDGTGEEEKPEPEKENNMIMGVAWYDENANGRKDTGEKLLSNIHARLVNIQNNQVIDETITNENGVYVLDKIKNGKYIVIFDFDTSKYAVTKYKAPGVAELENSNAIISELKIGEEKQQVVATDILELQNSNISNLNIGLIKKQNFDLSLNKYVNKILVQNAKGTTVKQYQNETMAKVELDAKNINGSTVIIEYKIEVTNKGEIAGYAKKIADYATSDLKFSSELNKDWYQVGNVLYTNSLANEKINPGQTKTVTLTLTKSMTENNIGLRSNVAEIAEDYNELGIADSNSTPGNRAKGENDMGVADVLISIRTGGVLFVSIAILVVAILGAVTIIVLKIRKRQ